MRRLVRARRQQRFRARERAHVERCRRRRRQLAGLDRHERPEAAALPALEEARGALEPALLRAGTQDHAIGIAIEADDHRVVPQRDAVYS